MSVRKRVAVKYIRTKFKLLSLLSKRKAAEQAFQLFCTPQIRNRNPLPPVFERATPLQFSFHNYTIRGYQWNHPSEKSVDTTWLRIQYHQLRKIRNGAGKKGYEVVAFDALAHGRSDGHTINVLLYKELIETIDKQYGPVKSFLAHSLGGLALSLALEAIPHDASYKVVLIAPATETTTSINFYFHYLRLDSEVRTHFDAVIKEQGGHPPEWFSVRRAATHIKAQVLWIHDEDDELTPWSDAQKVQQLNYPNFQFLITQGLGHRRIYRDKAILDKVIHFL